MNAKVISYDDMQNDLPTIVGNVRSGGTVLVQEANQPMVALIPFEYYLVVRKQLEDLQNDRTAETALEEDKSDPSTSGPQAELPAEWERAALDVLDEYDEAWKRLADL